MRGKRGRIAVSFEKVQTFKEKGEMWTRDFVFFAPAAPLNTLILNA